MTEEDVRRLYENMNGEEAASELSQTLCLTVADYMTRFCSSPHRTPLDTDRYTSLVLDVLRLVEGGEWPDFAYKAYHGE